MYFVFLILLVTVSARDISQLYSNEPRQDRFERHYVNPFDNFNSNNHRQNGFVHTNNHQQFNAPNNGQFVNNDRNYEIPFINPPLERDHRNRQESVNYHGQNGFVSANNAEQFNMQNIPNDNNRNDRSWNRQANQGYLQENLNVNREQFNAQRNRQSIPSNYNDRDYDRNMNPKTNTAHPHANFNNNEQSVVQNNRDIISNGNNRNDRTKVYPTYDNAGIMSINLGFNRQGNQNRREQSNLNIPRQSFNINNEYSNGNDANNRSVNRNNNRNNKYNENLLNVRRHQDEMTLGDHDRETPESHRRPSNNQNNNNGIVSFLNHLNNTNQTPNRSNQRHQSGLKSTNTAYKPKTPIENEVTQNPLENGKVEKENETSDEWSWGLEDTTMSPVTVDDRAAFSGDKCAQGLVRFMGKCVSED